MPSESETAQEHELKTWSIYFDAVARGDKTFEVRRDDRGFQKGDILVLRRFDSRYFCFTGERLRKRISYILTGGQFGIEPGYVVMGLGDVA
jgi:hypothetical protein